MTGVAPRPEAIIALDDVRKVYRNGELKVEALRGVTLQIAQGE